MAFARFTAFILPKSSTFSFFFCLRIPNCCQLLNSPKFENMFLSDDISRVFYGGAACWNQTVLATDFFVIGYYDHVNYNKFCENKVWANNSTLNILQRPSFSLLCGSLLESDASKTILNDWSWKIVSVWRLIILGLAIKCFMFLKLIFTSQILAFSDIKLKSLVIDSSICNQIYENIFKMFLYFS